MCRSYFTTFWALNSKEVVEISYSPMLRESPSNNYEGSNPHVLRKFSLSKKRRRVASSSSRPTSSSSDSDPDYKI